MTDFPFRRRAPWWRPAAFLILSLFGCIPGSRAQEIRGLVRADDGMPLPGVSVYVETLQRGTATDGDGRYSLERLPAGDHVVRFSYVGFRTETRRVEIEASQVTLDVILHPEVIEQAEVVVEGHRSPQDALTASSRSISVLDAKELDELRGQTLGETMEHLPGVSTLETGPSISKPIVRGLHSQRVLVLNAGVPQEGQQWGAEHAPEIDPFSMGRIEVLRGAASVEYGAGAMGGVIRVDPRELPVRPGIGGVLMLNGFSNNRQGAGSLLVESAVGAVPGLAWSMQGSYRAAGDARTPDYVIGNSAFRETNGAAALGYHRGRTGIEARASHFGTELGLFRGAHIGNADDLLRAIEAGRPLVDYDFSYEVRPPKQTISHDLVTLKVHRQLASGGGWEAQYGFQRNQREEFDAHRAYNDSLAALDRPAFALTLVSNTLEAHYHHRPLGHFLGTAGFNAMTQGNTNGESGYLIPNFDAVTGGVFARESWIGERVTLEGGARFDYRWMRAYPREFGGRGDFVRREHDYASLSGVLGAVWRFSSTWSLAMNASTGWRAPSVNELYNFGVHHGTAQFEIGDPDLTPERNASLDATLRQISDRAELEVSAYANRVADFIYLFPEPEPTVTIRGTFPTFRYAQSDALLKGFDGLVRYRLFRPLWISLTASIVRGDNLDRQEPLILMPSDRMTVRMELDLPETGPLSSSKFELEQQFVREQTRVPDAVDYAPPPPGYRLFGATCLTDVDLFGRPVSFSLAVRNLFNTTYRDYLSRFRYFTADPGRTIVVRLRVPLGADTD